MCFSPLYAVKPSWGLAQRSHSTACLSSPKRHYNLHINRLIGTQMPLFCSHAPLQLTHIVKAGTGAQMERNKANICSCMKTWTRRSVGALKSEFKLFCSHVGGRFDHRCSLYWSRWHSHELFMYISACMRVRSFLCLMCWLYIYVTERPSGPTGCLF